jgi:hypothetical protein
MLVARMMRVEDRECSYLNKEYYNEPLVIVAILYTC